MQSELDRCLKEIAAMEGEIVAGHHDLQRLYPTPSDWGAELRILQDEKRRQAQAQRRSSSNRMDQAFTGIIAVMLAVLLPSRAGTLQSLETAITENHFCGTETVIFR
jgi:hypothetical protein